MTAALTSWWQGQSARERLLLKIAGALLVAALLSLLARPALAAWQGLETAHREAVARQGRIAVKLDLLAGAPAPVPSPAADGQPLTALIADRAAEAGLTLSRNDALGDGGTAIAVASARAPAALAWLAGLESAGLALDQVSLTPGPDGTVALAAEVRAR